MKKNKKILIIILVILLVIVLGLLARWAYARFAERVQESGITQAQVAKPICEMEVEAVPSSKDVSVVSPYCIIKVRNYKDVSGNREITETDESYTLTMSPVANFQNPGFYWVEVANNTETIISRNEASITGTLNKGTATEKTYKIVFQNLGDVDDLTKLVSFNLVAVQIKPE